MKMISLFAGLLLFFCGMTTAVAAQPLLTPIQVHRLDTEAEIRVIDVRPAQAYANGHIPGAVSAPYARWRGPEDNPGQLPANKALESLVRSLGLDGDTHVIMVSSGENATDFGSSARVYWTLKYLGLNRLSILNGGFKAWHDKGLPQTREVPKVSTSHYHIRPDADLIADTATVAEQANNPGARLIDARPHEFYIGGKKAPSAAIAGTIKGAVNVEQGRWFKPGTGIFVSRDKAKKIAEQLLPGAAEDNITFCNTGHWGATDWFALSEVVGMKNVRLYPESLAAWTQDSRRPLDNAPGRGQQILDQLKGVFK